MGVEKTITKEGTGEPPKKGANITVHCTGLLTDSKKKFWSTKDAGQEPFSFRVGIGQVIRGWDEGCLSMKLGECATLVCSGDYAYGDRGFPAWGIGPNASLTFEIEVLKIA